MNNPITRLIARYKSLPQVPFVDKVKFATWMALFKQLRAKNIVDSAGVLLEARFKKDVLPPPQHTYEQIIFTCGFGWSGASATGDLIREHAHISSLPSEFDIVRAAGGLYSLEHAFCTKNIFERDAALRIFLTLAEHTYVTTPGFYDEQFLCLTREFVEGLIDYTSKSPTGFDNCPHLSALGCRAANRIMGHNPDDKTQPIYFLKDLSVAEYRKLAAAYIRKILKTVESEKFLVLDQGCADCSADMDRFEDYFGPFKAIYTYRDPRDVFTAANNARKRGQNEGYVPGDAQGFVKWYKRALTPFKNIQHPKLMLLQFEDLIVNHEIVIPKIQAFLGLAKSDHIATRTRFMPEESCAISMGLWKEYADQESIHYIESQLEEYCFHKDYVQPKRKLYTSTGVRA